MLFKKKKKKTHLSKTTKNQDTVKIRYKVIKISSAKILSKIIQLFKMTPPITTFTYEKGKNIIILVVVVLYSAIFFIFFLPQKWYYRSQL